MYVDEIFIDGFKSYAARTTLTKFSPHFNAITGLNGSGKSNILDAICFVLGLNSSNLQQVRAQSLNDLVIGGKNKFLVNGSQAHQNTVQNLFQSVQLNINNPHFLIMQGRITKVLNMKPQEILALIEEAAGTRMFEEKKEKALKTIDKKELKVQEITELMDRDIAPKLEKLKKEKQDFLSFQRVEAEVERLKMFVVAHDFYVAEQLVKQGQQRVEEKKEEVQLQHEQRAQLEQDQMFCTERIGQLQLEKQSALKKSGQFTELQSVVSQLSNQLTRLHTQSDLEATQVEEERQSMKAHLKNKKQLADQITKFAAKVQISQQNYEKERISVASDQQNIKQQEGFLQTLTTGIADSEGQENGFAEQIEAANVLKSKAKTEFEQAKQRQQFIQQQLDAKQPKAREAEKENQENTKQAQLLRAQIDRLTKQKNQLAFDPDREGLLKKSRAEAVQIVRELQQEIDQLTSKLSRLDFRYQDPHPNFDRRKVKGVLGKLVRLEPENLEYCQALQLTAADRLYNVVVEDNRVASELLDHGNLQQKTTFIPLKQIVPPNIPKERLQKALAAAPGKVEAAINLVNYTKDLEPAMRFAFGGTMICRDYDSAKKVSYDKSIRLRSITTDGDVYDPGAVITGGSSSNQTNVLELLNKLSLLERDLNEQKLALKRVNEELEAYQIIIDQYNAVDSELRGREYEFNSLDKLMQSSPAGQLIAEVSKLKQEFELLNDDMKDSQKRQTEASSRIKALDQEMREFAGNRDGKLKKIEKDLKKAKDSLAQRLSAFKELESVHISLQQDLEQMQTDLREIDTQIELCQTTIEKGMNEQTELKSEITELQKEYDQTHQMLQKQSSMFAQFDKDIKSAEVDKKRKAAQVSELQLEIKKAQFDLDKLIKDHQDAEGLALAISQEHTWIKDQKQNFGRANTAFDFQSQDASKCRKELKRLQTEYEDLRKRINVKVMNMIDRVVQKERSLKQMLATVKKDKEKIEETIEQLDHYKREALQRTWTKVNGDFGAIFNDLLPGNSAKLEPPEGQTVNDGLEVKVRLGQVWKQSLTELSGGQRSLVALSLILSLLQFKPAPMYILDEIDAALDLSHTQNIGHLFKTRFKGSQFIVVSLKEGMFNNADVLFKARFRDGTSVVERFEQNDGPPTFKNSVIADKENVATQPPAKKSRRKNVTTTDE